MAQTDQRKEHQWACEQIDKYKSVFPRYSQCAQTLRQVLEMASKQYAPLAIVQTRPKTAISFTEKAIRKKKAGRYEDPLMRMTDLCGGRVITQTQAEVEAVCKFIEKHFEIDRENSLDVSQRLKPTEFGYRSVHYVVQFKPGVFPTKEVPVEIPEDVYPKDGCPMKAEIQVRTVLEHAWAAFGHDRVYKSEFTIPVKWQRELAVLAGMLEEVDQSFSRVQAGLRTYVASYGAYMDEEQMQRESEILEMVLACDPQNAELAHRIGKLAMTSGDWEKARGIFSRYVETGYQPILRDLGVVLCKLYAEDPAGTQYRQGQEYLRLACEPPNQDVDALASLAGSWKQLDEEKTRTFYHRAFEVDPTDPYAVSNYLVYEITYRRDLSPVPLMRPAINLAIQRSHDQVEVGINLPWAFYNLGLFFLLLDQPYESLIAYAKAIQLSPHEWMIETSLCTLQQLEIVQNVLTGYEWVRRLLLIGQVAKFPKEETLSKIKGLALADLGSLAVPAVIVAGGCDVTDEIQMRSYRPLLIEAFHDFAGTIISGGTTAGVSGLVGKVGQTYAHQIRTIGYMPTNIPAGVLIDKRYSQTYLTAGHDFSVLEPLQYWIDLFASGNNPSQIKLLGINGGRIAAVEYRIALMLGANVAIVEGSGREAALLFQDDDWNGSETLFRLPADPMTARAFVGPGSSKLEIPIRDVIAQAIHEEYRKEQIRRRPPQDPALVKWDGLSSTLKESNCRQADHIVVKLEQIGCTLHKVSGREPKLFVFTEGEVELMAEMEHGRWVSERLQDGWKWALERDIAKKTSPYLVAWSRLPEDVKEWDRATVRKVPELLASVGMEIQRM